MVLLFLCSVAVTIVAVVGMCHFTGLVQDDDRRHGPWAHEAHGLASGSKLS